MKKAIIVGLTLLASLVAAAPAFAGFRVVHVVTADSVARFGRGALGSARASNNSREYIGCSRAFDTVTCAARDGAGTTVTCFTSDPSMVATFSAITSSSFIFFRYDEAGVCTVLNVAQYSYYQPLTP